MGRPTMEDVATRAGVSRALVSLVMRQAPNVSAHRRRRVLDAAAELGYRPNVLARNLASTRTMTIGVLLNDLHNPFFAQAFEGIKAVADARTYRLLVNTGPGPADETRALESLLELHVDGVIAVGPLLPTARLVAADQVAPVTVIGRRLRSPTIDTICNDDALGSRLAVDHLVGMGHCRIAHIDGGGGAGAAARRAGYERTMRDHGLGARIQIVRGAFTEAAGMTGVEQLLESSPRPTAIFCGNDLSAAGALDRLDEAGLDVPAAVSVVGYDDTPLSALNHISLTTVNQPSTEMGRLAVEALLERLEDGRTGAVHRLLGPTLVARGTSAPPPRSPRGLSRS